MSLIAIICFLICLGIIVSTFPRASDVFSPARVFGFIWSLAFGLAELKLSGLQRIWSTENWIHMLIGPVSFLAGAFIIYVLNLDKKFQSINNIRKNWQFQKIDHRKLFYCIIILFVLFAAGYIILLLAGREIPLFSSQPGKARKEFQMFGIGLFLNHVPLIVFLTVLYFISITKRWSKKALILLLSVISFSMYTITLQRLNLFIAIILAVILLYYATHKIRVSTVLVVSTILIICFYSISTIRNTITFTFFLFKISKMNIPIDYTIITEPYMYIVMNLEMFVHSMNNLDQFTYGYYTFDFVTSLTGLKHWIQEYYSLEETPFLFSGYNTYTAFWTYYRDFGVFGLFSIGLLGGCGISSLYYSLRKNPRFHFLAAYCIAVFVMLFSFFNSQIGFLWFVYNAIVLYLVVWSVTKRCQQIRAS